MPPPTKPQNPANISDENWAHSPTAPTWVLPSEAIIIVSTIAPVVVSRFCSAIGPAITATRRMKSRQGKGAVRMIIASFRIGFLISIITKIYRSVHERPVKQLSVGDGLNGSVCNLWNALFMCNLLCGWTNIRSFCIFSSTDQKMTNKMRRSSVSGVFCVFWFSLSKHLECGDAFS